MLDAQENLKAVGRVSLDSKNRVSVVKALEAVRGVVGAEMMENMSFRVYTNDLGHIILKPEVSVPAHELWLYKNPEALDAVQRGIKEAEDCRLVERAEDFTKFADLELE